MNRTDPGANGNQTLARNVRRLREERQLSIGELGRRAEISKQTVAAIELGSGNPTVDTVGRLAHALNVSMRSLLSEYGSEVLVIPAAERTTQLLGAARLSTLGQIYGSGYVVNAILELSAGDGPTHQVAAGRGALRHCYVTEGTVRLGPDAAPVEVSAGDFARFPGDVPHSFEAISANATVFVCTTAPQASVAGTGIGVFQQ